MFMSGRGVIILGEEDIYLGRKVKLKKLHLNIREKATFHEIVVFGESVAILPFINGDEVIIIKQFRGPIGGWIYEIPAGRVEPGEELEDACIRELEEEIGYRPKKLEKLASCYLTPGYSDEKIHIFVAYDLEYVGHRLEETEAIETIKIKYRDLLEKVMKNEIEDAKTILAVLLYSTKKR